MPKIIPTIPDELLLTKFSELDAVLPLTPQQVAMMLGKTVSQLQEARKAGSGPKFDSNGGRVRYFVGHVREYLCDRMNNHTHTTTRAARIAEENKQAGFDLQAAKKGSALGFTSLDQFLIYGDESDLWPFAIVQERAIDFFSSLQMELPDDTDFQWLTVGEFLSQHPYSSLDS